MPASSRTVDLRRVLALLVVALLAFGGFVAQQLMSASSARADTADEVVYNSIPTTLPDNWVSYGLQAEATHEFGDLIQLGGTGRVVSSVDVGFSSWACETGAWNTSDCVSEPGATFDIPVTVTLYEPATGAAGAVLATVTQTITAPYRPSSDLVNCAEGRYESATGCMNGVAFTASFDFSGLEQELPDEVVVGVSFDTRSHGSSPIGSVGPWSAFNVALGGVTSTVGADPDTDIVYINKTAAGNPAALVATPGYGPYAPIPIIVRTEVPTAGEPPAVTPPIPGSADDIPSSTPQIPASGGQSVVSGDERTLTLELGPGYANQWFYVSIYSTPTAVGWVWVGPTGSVTFPLPDSLPGGSHTVALVDASGTVVAYLSGVSIPALLAATGFDARVAGVSAAVGLGLLVAGGGLLLVRRTRRAA